MSRLTPRVVVALCFLALAAIAPVTADAQRRAGRVPPHPPGHFAVRGHVVFDLQAPDDGTAAGWERERAAPSGAAGAASSAG
jgi:hypothetical protein